LIDDVEGRLFIPSVHFAGCPRFGMRGQQELLVWGNHSFLLVMASYIMDSGEKPEVGRIARAQAAVPRLP
jgi:hypothetical protein